MFKKFIIFFIIIFLPLSSFGADYSGSATYNNRYKQDTASAMKRANDNLRMYELTDNKELKDKYLKEALRNYYICVKNDFSNIEAHIGLAKVYDEMGVDRYAKIEFNSAYNIDNKNPKLNYRYGDFYYKRKELSKAQNYFERAYKFGYSKNADLNTKMAKTYVKLAEPEKAKQHFKIAEELTQKEKTKSAVNSAMKAAKGFDTGFQTTSKPAPKKVVQPEKPKPEQKTVAQKSTVSNSKKMEDAVKEASKIKMIDDADKLKPMYYLFIK